VQTQFNKKKEAQEGQEEQEHHGHGEQVQQPRRVPTTRIIHFPRHCCTKLTHLHVHLERRRHDGERNQNNARKSVHLWYLYGKGCGKLHALNNVSWRIRRGRTV